MIKYFNAQGEVRELPDDLYAAWISAGNPKAAEWTLQPEPPAYDPQTHSVAWDGAQWVASALPPPEVPTEVQGHLCRIELIVRGEFDAVLAVIAAMPEPTRSIATEALYAPYFSRNSPTMAAIAQLMGWSSEDVDARFIAADARVV